MIVSVTFWLSFVQKFFGKVVRVDLHMMGLNQSVCLSHVRRETYSASQGRVVVTGPRLNASCVVVLDLQSLHPKAIGFRRGFLGGE